MVDPERERDKHWNSKAGVMEGGRNLRKTEPGGLAEKGKPGQRAMGVFLALFLSQTSWLSVCACKHRLHAFCMKNPDVHKRILTLTETLLFPAKQITQHAFQGCFPFSRVEGPFSWHVFCLTWALPNRQHYFWADHTPWCQMENTRSGDCTSGV